MTDVIKKRRQQELQEMESRTQNSYQMMQEEIQKGAGKAHGSYPYEGHHGYQQGL